MTNDEGRPVGAASTSSARTVPRSPDALHARTIDRQLIEVCWRVVVNSERMAVSALLGRMLAHFDLIEPDPDRPGEARLTERGEALGRRKVRRDARRLGLEVPDWAREPGR